MLPIEPLLASAEAFSSATARADRARLLAQMRDQLENLRVADEKSQAELERALEGGIRVAEAEQTVSATRKDESAAAEILLPRILSLQRYLTGTSLEDDPEAHQLLQKAVNVAIGYIAGYQNVRDQLIRIDAGKHAVDETLRARPVEGKIDYAELSREHIARYPKIRARLAE